jgi:hypothetical protein
MAGGPANGTCGPFCAEEGLGMPEIDCNITNFLSFNTSRRLWGPRWTYCSPKTVGNATLPLIQSCVSPGYISAGSEYSSVMQLVNMMSAGSRFLSFYGQVTDVNSALKDLEYVESRKLNHRYDFAVCENVYVCA